MRRFLQLRLEFIFSSLISEFGNASKATSGVRCNIIIGQPQFANLFLIPCLDSSENQMASNSPGYIIQIPLKLVKNIAGTN